MSLTRTTTFEIKAPRATKDDFIGEKTLQLPSAPRATTLSAARAIYRVIVRRRVKISMVLFSTILAIEGLLGVGWHHVNLHSDIIFAGAIAILLLGLSIRSWAAGTIQKNRELAKSGAYSLCRHPLYLGSFLMISGVCLGTHPLINFPIVAPIVAVIYLCSIRSEEVVLSQLFASDWPNYSANTPRLIPNPLRAKIVLTAWSFEQWRSNREYQAVLATVAGIGGMFAWYAFY